MIETVHANLRKLTHSLESCLQKATQVFIHTDTYINILSYSDIFRYILLR